MSKSQRDIEYEMSRFEAEITKLTPAAHVISAAPVNSYCMKPRSVGNMGMPQTLGNVPGSFSAYSYQPPIQVPTNPYMNQMAQSVFKPTIPDVAKIPDTTAPQKRDNSGNNLQKSTQKPTTAAAAATAVAAQSSVEPEKKKHKSFHDPKKKKFVRSAGGQTWVDDSLADWNPDDFRLFCGDLGNEVNDESLSRAFQKYPSFQKGKVIRDKKNGKTKGYGFVSFRDSVDFIKAMREMNGKYVGNRPIKLRKSNWTDRNIDQVRKKEVEKQKMGLR